MITLALSFLFGCGIFAVAFFPGDCPWGWSVLWGVLSFGLAQGVAVFFLQKRVKAEMAGMQAILAAGQRKIQQKTQRWQMRPPGSVKAAQKEIFEETKLFIKEALAQTAGLERFRLWIPMMDRQIATVRLQLFWTIKDFKQVDLLMPKVLFIDPTMAVMKMARLQMTGGDLEAIRKVYRHAVARVRYNGNVLLAATMSWIELQRGETDAAFKTLTAALKKSDNETLKRNHECLMNNRAAHFSNSGIGDMWYSLFLEEPKVHLQRSRPVYR